MARKKGSKDYPLSIKLEAIRLWEEEDLSYKEITERLAIRDPKRVKEWMGISRKEGKAGLKKPRRGRLKKGPDSLEERIKQLEMENTLLKALAIELGEELPEGLDIGPSTDIEPIQNLGRLCLSRGVPNEIIFFYYPTIMRSPTSYFLNTIIENVLMGRSGSKCLVIS